MEKREIKFRAWDKWASGMIDDFGAIRNMYTLMLGVDDNNNLTIRWEGDAEADLPLMQYTGLKDKNGKEIYEGDIIIGREQKVLGEPIAEGMYKVLWEHCGFTAKALNEGGCDTWLCFFQTNIQARPLTECELIGNIYEHPELLK